MAEHEKPTKPPSEDSSDSGGDGADAGPHEQSPDETPSSGSLSDASERGNGDAAGGSDTSERAQRDKKQTTPAVEVNDGVPAASDASSGTDGGDVGAAGAREGASWAQPFARLDMAWTRLETYLATGVLVGEVLALTLWVFLKGMSTPVGSASAAGVVFRAITGAIVFGLAALWITKERGEKIQRWASMSAAFAGLMLGKVWIGVGVDYTSNLLNWYQQASTLTLFGGLLGIATRLTLLLALLGGSLATARGKHITIDLVTRYVGDRVRLPLVIVGWISAAIICITMSWGFFDHIAIENFGADADWSRGKKVAKVIEKADEDMFILRKQITLDFKSTPHIVFKGESYAEWLKGPEWNAWLADAGYETRYTPEEIEGLKLGLEDSRAPMVVIPGLGEPRGELVHLANLVFPFGLLIIGLRFLLRSLLALGGWVSVDPEDAGEFSQHVIKKKLTAERRA